jgi:hypothetical protein
LPNACFKIKGPGRERKRGWLESYNFKFIPNEGTDDAGMYRVTANSTNNNSEF